MNVLKHPKFMSGYVDTYFIDENPGLFKFAASQNRAQKLLYYLGEVMVNGPQTPLATDIKPADIEPTVPSYPFCEFLWPILFVCRVAPPNLCICLIVLPVQTVVDSLLLPPQKRREIIVH
jgi:hypothetical protein